MSTQSDQGRNNLLKKMVLEDQMGFLCEELGDPGRYFPYLRSKKMLDSSDCQSIRSQATFREQVQQLLGILKGRRSSKGEQAFDVLVDALKRQRVQAHVARTLQKALAKVREDPTISISNGIEIETGNIDLPEEEMADQPPVVHSRLTTSDLNETGHRYEIHPVHGALPPLPTDPCGAVLDSPVDDEQAPGVHPQHGMLPPRSANTMCAQHDSGLKAEVSANFSGSESELGGQSQPNSMRTDSSNADSSTSFQLSSHDTTTFCMSSYGEYIEPVEVSKLEAKVKTLTVQLEEALSESKKKDVQIQKLQQLLEKAGMMEGSSAAHSYATQPVRPYKLKMNGSDSQVHTPSGTTYSHHRSHAYHFPSISPQSLGKELHEQPQGCSLNNFTSHSKSNSASVSFV